LKEKMSQSLANPSLGREFPASREFAGNFRYYGATATRSSSQPSPAFGAWSSLTLYLPFASSALKSAATFTTWKNGSGASEPILQIWMPRSSCFRLAQIPMPSRPSVLIAGQDILRTMNCPGLRRTRCGPASGPLASAEIAAAVMQAKGMPADDAAFKELVVVRALTVLRRLAKRGIVAKSGTSRNAQWALVHQFANMSVNNC
jgi:hypothetical protein